VPYDCVVAALASCGVTDVANIPKVARERYFVTDLDI
jgi:uncharacterized OsmC-like protein